MQVSSRVGPAQTVTLALALTLIAAGCRTAATDGPLSDTGSPGAAAAALTRPAESAGVDWAWLGGVTGTSAVIKAKVAPASHTQLLVGTAPGVYDPELSVPAEVVAPHGTDRLVAFHLTDLTPATRYHYAVALDGAPDAAYAGTFRTFPSGAADITVAFASCADTGSDHAVFDRIRAEDPDLFIHMGDLHYEDIAENDLDLFRAAYDAVLASPAQSALYRSVPLAYVWDDHDFGANNSAGDSPSRPAALESYNQNVPHYPLAGTDTPIFQAFTIARVRVLLTDTHSSRDQGSGTMLGATQKAWLKSELLAGRDDYPLVVWVNPSPWIDEPNAAARLEGTWGAFPDERKEIAEFITENNIDNVVMLSGDAHMLAIDDGTNNRYGDPGGPPGFPIMQAAAMDRDGSEKGGPYSEGTFPGGGQYGLMRVTDPGDGAVTVDWSGWNERGERAVDLRFTVPAHSVDLTRVP